MELHDDNYGLTPEQVQQCRETIRRCHTQLDRTTRLLKLRNETQASEAESQPAVFAPDSQIEEWLQGSTPWPKLKTLTALALLLVALGCSSPQVVESGPCTWRTSVKVEGPGGHPELTAEGRCRGKLWGLAPVTGSLRCVASVDLPGVSTSTGTGPRTGPRTGPTR